MEQNKRDIPAVKELEFALPAPKNFSGVVHTICYRPHNGFANYTIGTLTIEKGVVKKIEYSDPYAAFETIIRLELMNEKKVEHMRRNYPAGFRQL